MSETPAPTAPSNGPWVIRRKSDDSEVARYRSSIGAAMAMDNYPESDHYLTWDPVTE